MRLESSPSPKMTASSASAVPPFTEPAVPAASAAGCSLTDLVAACDGLLQPALFKDYGPNGLQVEGRADLRKIVSGVTASRALIEAAIAAEADAILVHHGLFWRGQDGRVTGWNKQIFNTMLRVDETGWCYYV